MLKAIPKSWFSWDFTVLDGERPIADIDISWWRERGVLSLEGRTFSVRREGILSTSFLLESEGTTVARAEKTSVLFRSFLVEHGGRQYTLQAKSAFRREFQLLAGSEEIGAISPEGWFTRRARVDLPEALPLAVRVFLVWLTLILWKREADSSNA